MADNGKLMIEDFQKNNPDNSYYNVQDFDYELNKPYENNYKPSANVRGGIINFTLLSDNEDDLYFHNWIFNIEEVHNGWFMLPVTAGLARNQLNKPKYKRVEFEGAYCIRLSEFYSNSDPEQMHMRISIVAPEIKFGEKTVFGNDAINNQE